MQREWWRKRRRGRRRRSWRRRGKKTDLQWLTVLLAAVEVAGRSYWRRWRCQRWRFSPFLPCFFFSSSFFFLSRFSPLYPYSAPLFFLSIPLYCFFFFFPVFLLFFLCFFFSFSLSVFCSLLYFFLFFPVLYPPFFFFYSLFPYFYRKNRGERARGNHYAAGPKTARGAHSLLFSPPLDRPQVRGYTSGVMVGLFYAFWRKRERKVGEKISFFPCLACPEEEEDLQCRSKRHHLGLFFTWTVHETALFWTKRAVSFKRKRRQKGVRVHIGP